MGLMDDFGVDANEIEAPSWSNPADGIYEFEIAEAYIQNGTKNDPDVTKFVIKYSLDEAGEKSEFFTTAEDGEITERALQSLGFLKARLTDLGLDPAKAGADDLEGIRGTLKLVTTNGKGKNSGNKYQNIRDVKVSAPAAKPKAAPKTSSKKAAAKQEDEDDNPFE